jgi:regulator of ribonuclease activity A
LLIDGGGSLTRALSGDQVAKTAMDNGWAGMVIIGAVRDVEIINTFEFCVLALGTSPIKTQKLGQGDRGAALSLGGVAVSEGDFLAGDQNGVLVLDRAFNVL